LTPTTLQYFHYCICHLELQATNMVSFIAWDCTAWSTDNWSCYNGCEFYLGLHGIVMRAAIHMTMMFCHCYFDIL